MRVGARLFWKAIYEHRVKFASFVVVVLACFLLGGGVSFVSSMLGRPQPVWMHPQILASPFVIALYGVGATGFFLVYRSAEGLRDPRRAVRAGVQMLLGVLMVVVVVFCLQLLLVETYVMQ